VPYTQFTTDVNNHTLPDFVWITPNLCNDMHDCSVSTGDTWLSNNVPLILNSPAWQNGGVLFVTFDEGTTSAGCCSLAAGGHVVTLVISPLGKLAFRSGAAYDHYSLLRTIEDAWALDELRNTSCACSAPMNDFWITTP
jgi:phosphatidylinositol-3-phosphatase